MILTIVLFLAKFWGSMYRSITLTKGVVKGAKEAIAPPEMSKKQHFFLKHAKFSCQRRGLRPAPLFWGVNTCNLAKLGQKRTIFKHVF